MPLTIQQLRGNLRRATGEDKNELPDQGTPDQDIAGADDYINRAFWELTEKFKFREDEKTVVFTTQPTVQLYEVPLNLNALAQISIEDPTTLQHSPLLLTTQFEYESKYSGSADKLGIPTNYLREGNLIRLYPTPDAEYNLTLKYHMTLADLTDSNGIPKIPQAWHEIIEYGAKWRRFADIGDYVRSNANKTIAYNLIAGLVPTEAKEKADTKMAGLNVVRFDNYV